MKLNDAVAGELRAHLARRDIKTTEAAARIGVRWDWLSRRLNGATELSLGDVERICIALEIPIVQVLHPAEDIPA